MFLVAFGYFRISRALQFLLWDGFYQCTILPKDAQAFKPLFVPGCGSWLVCVGVSLGRLLRGGHTSAAVAEKSVCALQSLHDIEQVLKAGLFFQDEWKVSSYFCLEVEVRRDFSCVHFFATLLWRPSVSTSCLKIRWPKLYKALEYRRTTESQSDIFSFLYPSPFYVSLKMPRSEPAIGS